MAAVGSVLVVGGGLAGCAATILLAEAGVKVQLVEARADASALGSGITLQGNALRVLSQLGVWGEVESHGFGFSTTGMRSPDGAVLREIPVARTGGPDLPAVLGMDRRKLAAILLRRAQAVGAKVRLGVTPTRLGQDGHGIDVAFSDGSASRYDVVIGADGVRSWTRRALGIELLTRPTGMGIWRIFGPRPAAVVHTDLYYGGSCYIAGYCPTGENSQYAYLVEDAQDRSGLGPEERLATVVELASAYHGPWDEIRAGLTDPAQVNYTWLETHLLEAPWNRGRVVLIGDAAHTCPPTIAQGGAQALEDAAVLAELLLTRTEVDDALWNDFTTRRHARASAVVHASVQLAQWQHDGVRGDVAGLTQSAGQRTGMSTTARIQVVDVHAHVLVPEIQAVVHDQPGLEVLRALEARRNGPASAAVSRQMFAGCMPQLTDVDRRLAAMDAAGIDVQVLSVSPSQYHYYAEPDLALLISRCAARGVAAVVAEEPGRFTGLGLVPLQHPQLCVEALDDALANGLLGVELSSYAARPDGRTVELSDPALEPLWARAAATGAVIFLHPMGCSLDERLDRFYLSNTVGQPVENAVALSHLIFSGVLDRHPTLRIVAAHGGGYLPTYLGRSDHAWTVRPDARGCAELPSAYLRNLWFDSLVHSPEALRALVAVVGADRVLLGSDFPFDMGVADPVERIQAAGFDATSTGLLLGGNAAALGLTPRPASTS